MLVFCACHSWFVCAQSSSPAMIVADQVLKTVTAGTVADLPLKLDPSAAGGDLLHVTYADSSLSISLVLPSGVVVNASNANSLGYDWEQATRTGLDENELLLTDMEGEHAIIGLPMGAGRGTYVVRVDARSASANASVVVEAMLTSSVSATLSVASNRYALNESVVLTGAAAEGTQVLLNPAMTLEVVRTSVVPTGLSSSNLRFVRSHTLTGGGYRHYFTADLVSGNVEAPIVAATVNSENGDVNFIESGLTYLAVHPGTTSTTPTTISLDTDSSAPPSTTGWLWSFNATQLPVTVPMQDGGPSDGVPGDGLFTGTFAAAQVGRYSAVLTATGTAPSGAEYKRIASTNFWVRAESGSVLACSDLPWDDDGNGKFDRLQVTAQVRAGQEAWYRVHLELADALGHSVAAEGYQWLTPGDEGVGLDFPAKALRRSFSGNGPYQRLNVQLWQLNDYDYHQELLATTTCGSTQGYQLADFEAEPIQLTGTATLVPVNQNGIPGYERLDFSQSAVAPYGSCHWYATLASADGTQLDTANGNGQWNGGSGIVTANFSGAKINRSAKSGPYQVSSLDLSCDGFDLHKNGAAVSALHTAADFEQSPADFTVSALNLSAQPGVPATSQVTTGAMGGFEGEIALAVSGLPSGWSASLQLPKVAVGGAVNLDIVPSSSTPVGTYSITLTATSGSIVHLLPVAVVVTAMPVTMSIQPSYANLHPGQTKQFSAQVHNAPDPLFHWLPPASGTLSGGLYQAPATIQSASRVYVIAVSNLDGTKYATASVQLFPPAQVSVTPTTTTLHATQSVSLQADVTNVGSSQVVWTMSPQVGRLVQTSSVNASYVAPNPVATSQTVIITATSVEDPSQAASMTVTLQP